MSIIGSIRHALFGLALAASLAVGLAATAEAQPSREDDFWECVGEHQDSDGIGVCCVFYGGSLEANDQECYIDFVDEAKPAPHRVPPRVQRIGDRPLQIA